MGIGFLFFPFFQWFVCVCVCMHTCVYVHVYVCVLWRLETFYLMPMFSLSAFSYHTTPYRFRGEGVYWNHFVRMSVCRSGCVSDHVHSVSPEPLYHILPNLVWRCITTRCIMQKNWFIIYNAKFTARVYIIKIWLFFSISSKLLVCLQPNLVWWYSIISRSVL